MKRAKRAKKSSIWSKILLMLILLIVVSGVVLTFRTEIEYGVASIMGGRLQSYSANDFVKDIFTEENGTRYIPIVYGDSYEQVSKKDILKKLNEHGITAKNIPDSIGTGTKIETEKATYTILIYGDVNGDGKVNVRDAQKIVQHLLYGNGYELKGINRIAANVHDEKKDVLDVRDAQRIVQFIIGKNKIIDSLPTSDVSKDKDNPVITLRGDNPMYVKLNDKYEEPGADVTDLDPNVKLEIIGEVDTSVPKEYVITYIARDASGNETKVTRIVIVEDEMLPVIEFNDSRKYIPINVGDKAEFEKLDLGAIAIDEKDGELTDKIKTTIIKDGNEVNKVDTDVPGIYEIKYEVTNSQGKTKRETKTIEIINYVTKIEIVSGTSITKTSYKEGQEIDLSGIKLNITKAFGNEEVELISLINDNNYEIKLTPSNNGKAVYDETKLNQNLKVTVKYTNPAPNPPDGYNEIVLSDAIVGRITVIGNIREFIDDNLFATKTDGDIYELLPIAKITSKDGQEQLTDTNLTYTVTPNDGTTHVEKVVSKDGVATIKFWGEKAGTYKIVLKGQTANASEYAEKTIDVTIRESSIVDKVAPIYYMSNGEKSLYDGVLKAGGEAKDISLIFLHDYGTDSTEKVTKQVPVTANRLQNTIIKDNLGGITNDVEVEFLDINKEKIDIADYNIKEVYGIRIKAIQSETTVKLQRKIEIHVDSTIPKIVSPDDYEEITNMNFEINPKSKYTVSLSKTTSYDGENVKLYLNEDEMANDVIKCSEDNLLYTLIGIEKVDQYPTDPDTQAVKALQELSTFKSDIIDGKIVFVDSANESDGTSRISVKGFTDESIENNVSAITGNIQYVGIALNNGGDEDEEVENEGSRLKVYHGETSTPVYDLGIDLIKEEIQNLKIANNELNEYCFEEKIVASIKSGSRQKEIDLSKDRLEFTILDAETNQEVETSKLIKIDEVTGRRVDLTQYLKAEVGEIRNGEVEIKFMSPIAGKYKVQIGLANKRVVEPVLTEIITVSENPDVSRVAFRYKDMNGNYRTSYDDLGSVRFNKSKTYDIIYYHDYYINENNVDKYITSTKLTGNDIPVYTDIQFTVPTEYSKYLKVDRINDKEILEEGTPDVNARATGVRITLKDYDENNKPTNIKVNDNLNFRVSIKNTTFSATLHVKAIEEASIVRAKVSEINPDRVTTSKLYTSTPPADTEDTVIPVTSGGQTDYYTLYKIAFIDSDGDEVPVTNSLITDTKEGKYTGIAFIDDTNESLGEDSVSFIQVSGFEYDEHKGIYSKAQAGATKVSYVGIAPFMGMNVEFINIYYNNKLIKTLTFGSRATYNMTTRNVPLFTDTNNVDNEESKTEKDDKDNKQTTTNNINVNSVENSVITNNNVFTNSINQNVVNEVKNETVTENTVNNTVNNIVNENIVNNNIVTNMANSQTTGNDIVMPIIEDNSNDEGNLED